MAHAIAYLLSHGERSVQLRPRSPDGPRLRLRDRGPDVHFDDAPPEESLCPDVHFLWAKGLGEGCTETEFCLSGEVTKASASEFLVGAFGLTLYDAVGPLVPPLDCSQSIVLCLEDSRFVVQATWKTPDGRGDFARAIPATSNSGFFSFSEPGNVELAVKVLNGAA